MITLTNGFPQGPNGLIVPNGSIKMQLNVDATVIAAPGGFVAADIPVVFQFDANGALIAPSKIWSNRELNPQLSPTLLGTYYLVTFYDQNGAVLNATPLWWQFPEVINSIVDISIMTPISTVGGNVIFYPTNFGAANPPGTVTSVTFTGDGTVLSATPSAAVTTSGTVTATLLTQSANLVLAGPVSGPAAAPTFRSLIVADMPATVISGTLAFGQVVVALSANTVNSFSNFAYQDISAGNCNLNFGGVVPTASLAVRGAGGVNSLTIEGDAQGGGADNRINISLHSRHQIALLDNGSTTNLDSIRFWGGASEASSIIFNPPTISTASVATTRCVDSEPLLNFGGSVNITGSVAGVRGNSTVAAGTTLASGYLYGIQGKITGAGTLANGSAFNAGVFGQVDTSAGGFVHTSGYLAPIMGDFGATSIMATDDNANMVSLLNTTNCIIHSALLFIGNASYALDLNDLAFGGAHFILASPVNTGDLANVKVKVRINGADYFLPLYTA
jgi:hypothetical protein